LKNLFCDFAALLFRKNQLWLFNLFKTNLIYLRLFSTVDFMFISREDEIGRIIDLQMPQVELTSVNTTQRRPDAGSVVYRTSAERSSNRESLYKGASDVRYTDSY